jgi:hypothetical protein
VGCIGAPWVASRGKGTSEGNRELFDSYRDDKDIGFGFKFINLYSVEARKVINGPARGNSQEIPWHEMRTT